MKTIGQIAYEAHCEYTGWRSAITGAELPRWEDTIPYVQQARQVAANAVQDKILIDKGMEDAQMACLSRERIVPHFDVPRGRQSTNHEGFDGNDITRTPQSFSFSEELNVGDKVEALVDIRRRDCRAVFYAGEVATVVSVWQNTPTSPQIICVELNSGHLMLDIVCMKSHPVRLKRS